MCNEGEVMTYRRIVMKVLDCGETLTTREVTDRMKQVETRHVPDATAYKILSKLHRDGKVEKELREEPGKSPDSTITRAYWRLQEVA